MSKNDFTLTVDKDGWIKDFFRCGNCENIFYTSKADRFKMLHWKASKYPTNDDRFLKDCPGCKNKVYLDGCEEPDIHIKDVLFTTQITNEDWGIYPIQDFETAFNKANEESCNELKMEDKIFVLQSMFKAQKQGE